MKFFKIDLPSTSEFDCFYWKEDLDSQQECFKDYCVAWVDVKRFISLCINNPYIPFAKEVSAWPQDKINRYIDGINLNKNSNCLCMPRVALNTKEINFIEKKLFGIWTTHKQTKIQYIGFVNGRHRTRIAEHLGAKNIPVQIHKSQVELLISLCSNEFT